MSSPLAPAGVGEVGFDPILSEAHAVGKATLGKFADVVDSAGRFPREALESLRQVRLLGAYVPKEYGGLGLDVIQVARVCEALGHYCGSSAMIYAMHQIQVACVVHHARSSLFFRDYLGELAEAQRLIASATTEVGVGGDLRSSRCALEVEGNTFRLTKQAPVISYAQAADDILVTCRRSSNASANEQAMVLLRRGDFTAAPLSGWDTLGFRGTCSSGFTLTASGSAAQVLPEPFADILAQTMHPFSHIVWGAVWAGIAGDALRRARAFVREEARKTPGETPLSAIRLAEADSVYQEMRHNVLEFAREYQALLEGEDPEAISRYGFAIRTNNLKLSSSQRVVDVVSRALLICGLSGYRNDSKFSLGRHLRDAYGAAVMVNNDRIVKLNATLLTAYKEAF